MKIIVKVKLSETKDKKIEVIELRKISEKPKSDDKEKPECIRSLKPTTDLPGKSVADYDLNLKAVPILDTSEILRERNLEEPILELTSKSITRKE